MPAKKTKAPEEKGKKEDDKKLYAFLATFLSIVGFIIALVAKKDDKYVMFYAKQSLVIFIAWIIAAILSFIPVIGWVLQVLVWILWLISWIYALSGEEKDIPVIGDLAQKLKI
jgi:uncharacterized membrane protein